MQFGEISLDRLPANYLRLNVNALFLLIMTKEMREAGVCYEAGTGFMCTRGELAEQANNMEPQSQVG